MAVLRGSCYTLRPANGFTETHGHDSACPSRVSHGGPAARHGHGMAATIASIAVQHLGTAGGILRQAQGVCLHCGTRGELVTVAV